MSHILLGEIKQSKIILNNQKLADDRAFSHVLLKYFFDVEYVDQEDFITDGANDGGIDFAYFDEEELKVIVCQSKFTDNLSYADIIAELDKMYSTIHNFTVGNTGIYNDRVKRTIQNFIDRLPDEGSTNIEYHLFTSSDLDKQAITNKIEIAKHGFSIDMVSLYTIADIERKIEESQQTLETVMEAKILIDKKGNYLEYESNTSCGVMVNVSSKSIVNLYNKYSKKGLFDLNIRKYIPNKLVDDGIRKTLSSDKERENFWFLNNGIVIACEDFDVDGNSIKLNKFSIVNGGQTTNRIAEYKGNNSQEFYVPCKIVAEKKKDPNLSFYTKIAEATNSQKPILPRDLKSNTPEMVQLSRKFAEEGIFFEIKRGVKQPSKLKVSIKNDEFGQMILSFVLQKPGTARSGKKAIFEQNDTYNRLFKQNYMADKNKKTFVVDCIALYNKYLAIEKDLKTSGDLSSNQAEILKNGKQIMLALFGVLYRLVNNDVTEKELIEDSTILLNRDFKYGAFISNYQNDDLDKKFRRIIINLVKMVTDSYKIAYDRKIATSVSNYFKTNDKYLENILNTFSDLLSMSIGEDLKAQIDIFKR